VSTLSIAASLTAASLRGQLQYRANFVVLIMMGLVYQGTGFVFIWVVLSRFHALAGWTLGEVAFLYGLRLLVHGLSLPLFGALANVDEDVRHGEFDRYLVRPLPALLQVMTNKVQANFIGDLSGGLLLFLTAQNLARIDWSPAALGYLALVLVGGVLAESGIRLLLAALSFRMLSTGSLSYLVDGILFNQFGNYPLKIYDSAVRLFLTFAVPVAFVAYLPATVLLKRTSELSISPWFAYLAPAFGALWFALAYLVWQHEIGQYQSTGH
jgi:ABC-2 type transport system permease protein